MADLDALLERARSRRSLPAPEIRRHLREQAGLTQAELAEVLGVSRTAVVRWEGGSRTPRGETLDSYLAALDRFARERAP